MSGSWVNPADRRASLIEPSRFCFLNETHEIASAADWDNPAHDKLWRYNLHYFDDLNAKDAKARAFWHHALIARWIAENPPACGTGWEPYPTSLRIVNWVKWALAGQNLGRDAEASLALQAQWLSKSIEIHLLGNHLLSNAKALWFAGLFFKGAVAERWARKGFNIVQRELREQILPDGGQFERSPMYHALALEDVLDLVNVTGSFCLAVPKLASVEQTETLVRCAAGMCRWLAAMCHPDGEIAFFNDAATGIAASPAALFEYGARLGLPVTTPPAEGLTHLATSGYVRLARGEWLALFDAAPVGPDYVPGHAHADTLSFEVSWRGHRVICNSGTSRYGCSTTRDWERSTAAHSTVEIDGESSSEVWHSFRVARRAYPVGLEVATESPQLRVSCGHDGYARLPGRPLHRRTFEVDADGITWTDEVVGTGAHTALGRIPLHPDVRVHRVSDQVWLLILASGAALRIETRPPGPPLELEGGRFSPEFGLVHERAVLCWRVRGRLPLRVRCRLAAERT